MKDWELSFDVKFLDDAQYCEIEISHIGMVRLLLKLMVLK